MQSQSSFLWQSDSKTKQAKILLGLILKGKNKTDMKKCHFYASIPSLYFSLIYLPVHRDTGQICTKNIKTFCSKENSLTFNFLSDPQLLIWATQFEKSWIGPVGFLWFLTLQSTSLLRSRGNSFSLKGTWVSGLKEKDEYGNSFEKS